MKNKILTLLGSCLLGTGTAFAQFTADFETDTTENWQVNIGPGSDGQGRVDFHFDYSTVGVPRSPNSKPGDGSYAMKLEANWDANVFSGLSVSPIGQSFEGNFVLKFDYWHNFIGPFPNKGSGGTMLSGAGIGTSGTSVEAATNARDAIAFEATGDGDSAFDYRVYPAGGRDDSYLTAGSGNNTDPHYAQFGDIEAPEEQIDLFPTQTGTTAPGTQGMAWHEWTITLQDDTVTWHIDGLLIATVENYSSFATGGNNIFFNRYDSNAGSSTSDGQMNFSLIDNITVIPEPSTYAAIFGSLILTAAALFRRRKTER